MTAGRSAGTEQGQGREDECPLSERVDGKLHSWVFDGDDPYVICHYCDQMQDAMTGRVIRDGNHVSPPVPPARDSGNGGALGQVTASRNAQSGRDEAPIDSPLIAGHAATGDQSGRDEAQEAVARWLQQVYGQDVDPLDRHPSQWDADAEHLLAHPALRKLLRDGTTT